MPDNQRLKGKAALVTGGGKGIGRSIALGFAEQGANIAVFGRTPSMLEDVSRQVRSMGVQALAVQADVSQEADVENAVEQTVKAFGRIDILVNNAGIPGPLSLITDTGTEAWNEVMGVNLTGMFLSSRAVLRQMIKVKQGNIINISSGAGRVGSRVSRLSYTVSKFGVEGFTYALAAQMKPYGICVNAIRPGWMDTDFHKDSPSEMKTNLRHPDAVKALALFLALQTAGTMTGQSIDLKEWESGIK